MVSPDSRWGQWESISNIYKTKIVVLASEPVGGRSRVTELPCFFIITLNHNGLNRNWLLFEVHVHFLETIISVISPLTDYHVTLVDIV